MWAVEVPGILPPLSLVEKAQGMKASFGMNHEEVFIICSMGVFHQSQQVFGSWRDGLERGPKKTQSMVPALEFGWAPCAELTAVVDPYGDGPSDIVSPEPQKDHNDKAEAKGGTQLMGVGGKSCPGGHIHQVPFIAGDPRGFHVVVDLWGEGSLV